MACVNIVRAATLFFSSRRLHAYVIRRETLRTAVENTVIDFNDLQMKTGYSLTKSVEQKALVDYLHAQEFTRRNGGAIPTNIIHQGVVKNTGIDRNIKGMMKFISKLYLQLMANSSEKGIENILSLAETNSKESGYFYPKLANITVKEKIDLDPSTASKVWDKSMKMGKLN